MKRILTLGVCWMASVVMAAEPAGFDILGTEPIVIPPGGSTTILISVSGAGTAQGMALYLGTTGPFVIQDLIVDGAGSGTVWETNTTGAVIYTHGRTPAVITDSHFAIGYVTTNSSTVSPSPGGVLAKVVISVSAGTPIGSQGSLNTNSVVMVPSDFATDTAVGQDQTTAVVLCELAVPGDFDADCDVDGTDLERFEDCATGPAVAGPPAGCTPEQFDKADTDDDTDADQTDFGIFQRCWSGENNLADPNCAD